MARASLANLGDSVCRGKRIFVFGKRMSSVANRPINFFFLKKVSLFQLIVFFFLEFLQVDGRFISAFIFLFLFGIFLLLYVERLLNPI